MGRTSSTSRFQVSCLNSASTRVRIGSRQGKLNKSGTRKKGSGLTKKELLGDYRKPKFAVGRRIMVVVDLGFEANSAIQWALIHTVQSQDTVVLVHVTKPSAKQCTELSEKEMSPRAYELLYSIKNTCHMERPEVKVEVAVVEGKEKGPTIVQEARNQGVSLLILGQRKRSIAWRLLQMWRRKRNCSGVVEYCIENANCMAIGVRRKSKKLGGYLITTKLHKNFWILA